MPDRFIKIESPEAVPIKAWVDGVTLDDTAREQLQNLARMPFLHGWLAVMPDVHWGLGATIGSVVPTVGAIIPAAVGVDIGCGMMAVKTTLRAKDLPDDLARLRSEIEAAIPHGRTRNGGPGDVGSWGKIPSESLSAWSPLSNGFARLLEGHPKLSTKNRVNHVGHLGTLGSGNHFLELCLDEHDLVWLMLHSGSRGVANRIGTYFIELARKDMERLQINLPDVNLAYLKEGTQFFDDYVFAVDWAQKFASVNRRLMMDAFVQAVRRHRKIPAFFVEGSVIDCHHNYVNREIHFGKQVWLTRKGALSARRGELGIIPGSMGAKSYVVEGLGNPQSFHSCSHGAGRRMSRNEAKKTFSLKTHAAATRGIECRKDAGVIDETPAAYKPIDDVIAAQMDLIKPVRTLRQLICVKG